MRWWGKKSNDSEEIKKLRETLDKLERQTNQYDIGLVNSQINNLKMKGGTNMAKQIEEQEYEDEEEEIEEDEDEDALPVAPVHKPKPIKKVKEEVIDQVSVVAQLPSQQIKSAMVDGKPVVFETIEEALSTMRNDIASIKKAVGA